MTSEVIGNHGLGWKMSYRAIARRTDQGLPHIWTTGTLDGR
jgi:hypothetical protein